MSRLQNQQPLKLIETSHDKFDLSTMTTNNITDEDKRLQLVDCLLPSVIEISLAESIYHFYYPRAVFCFLFDLELLVSSIKYFKNYDKGK